MKSIFVVLFSILSITLIAANNEIDKSKLAKEWLSNQPLAFIENKGQFTDSEGKPADNVLFKASYGNCDIYITTEGLSYVFVKYEEKQQKSRDTNDFRRMPGEKIVENKSVAYYRLDMNLQGSTINKTQIIKELPGKQGVTNYFYPHCPDGIYGVQEYGKITIKNIYKGIDWVIYTNADNKEAPLKYDFVIQPQADYKDIKIKFVNAQSTSLADNGTKLKIQTIAGTIEEGNLYSYQQNSTEKKAIKTNYISNSDSTFEFELGAYDKTKTLVIDPLVWATYYGGSSGWDFMKSICTDSKNNIYIIGNAGSVDFPIKQVSGAFWQSGINGYSNIFILKFDNQCVLQWATFYGGSYGDRCSSIHADSKDNIYITGNSNSADFPTQHSPGYYAQLNNGMDDAFILKFNDNGVRQWATFYGGSYLDFGISITTDSQDNIYFTGNTNSSDLPIKQVSGYFYQSNLKGYQNIFIVKFNNQGTLQWATYYGGTEEDKTTAITVDIQDNIYITGGTSSRDFPTQPFAGAYYQAANNGYQDIFIIRIDKQGTRSWATYYGGIGSESGFTICSDSQSNIYISGSTYSADFPTQVISGAFNQTSNAGGQDMFVLKFTNQCVRQWATYCGGSRDDVGFSISSDSEDNLYITGTTESENFPTQPLSGEYWQPSKDYVSDAFLTIFSNQGVNIWSTYYGGGDWDNGAACAVNSQKAFYSIGNKGINSYTIDYGNGAYFDNINGSKGYILKIEPCLVQKPILLETDRNNICINDNDLLTLTAIGGIGDTLKWYSDNSGLNYVGKGTPLIIPSPTRTTTYYARWESLCDISECDSVKVIIIPPISINRDHSICSGETYTVGITNYTTAGIYTDILKSASGCDSSIITNLVVNPINRTPLTPFICQGESYIVGTKVHTTTGIYSDTLTSVLFCDSIVTTNLTVNPAYQTTPSPFICPGETVTVGTHTYSATGTYIDKLTTIDGCDSIITTNLTVYPVIQNIQSPDKCTGESITVGVNTYTTTGTYTDILTDYHNCDSTVITHLTIYPTVINPITKSICEGETFTVGANDYSSTGNYIDKLKTTFGCDSTVTTILTVNPVPEVSLGEDQLLCPADTITLYPGTGFSSYLWSDGSVLSFLKVTSTGKYSVTVYNEWCPASDEISITECSSELRFPNAFSPNHDYNNDTFKPVILGTLNTFHLIIYTRWGQQVYDSHRSNPGWDGTFQGSLCAAGQYIYVATYSMGTEPSSQKQQVQRGAVTLLR